LGDPTQQFLLIRNLISRIFSDISDAAGVRDVREIRCIE
jgi:hypothetical protein